jgi:probable HAF family extracellular repeat protein
MLNKKFLSTASVLLAIGLLTPVKSLGVMIDLGTLVAISGSLSGATGVSGDGSIIVGYSDTSTTTHAFKYVGTTMTDLGALGLNPVSNFSMATGVSADGLVIVGSSDNGTTTHAFKYVGTTMTDLGALGLNPNSNTSSANGVSADGSVIVGTSVNGTVQHAFKYVGTTMTDLGALGLNPTSNNSYANGVSADGLVIVGSSDNGTVQHAFKYVGTTMTDLGALGLNPTLYNSYAYAVSADGSVIVGSSDIGSVVHAFKYVGTTMTDLGALGLNPTTNTSAATGVSADGSVIVGYSDNGTIQHAFKYVGTTMTDLGALGLNPASNNSSATGVSADGSVIVGYSDNGSAFHPFVYTDAGMVDVVEWMSSISGPAGILPMVNSLTSLPMEGAHHRPLMSLDMMGKKSQSWVTGDFGARSRTSDSHTTSGEAGVSSTFGRVMAGLAVGFSEQNNDLLFGGSSNISGQYILGEVDMRLSDNKSIVSVTAMLGNWKSNTLRGYGVGGGGVDYSRGSTSLNSTSVRLRIDGTPHKLIRGPSITPFASFTWSRTTADAYSESGGSYDAQFNKQSHVSKEGRVGLSTNFKLGKDTTLLTTLEWIHRFDKSEAGFTGTDIDHGALPFSVSGAAIHSNQARLGFDVDHKMNPTTMLNFSAHITSVGEAPDVSTALSLRRAF